MKNRKLLILALFAALAFGTHYARAGGPWSNQYCNLKTETVIVKDQQGKILDTKTIEKVECEDGVKDFLHGAKIAKDCRMFTWKMPLGETHVEQRSIACKRLDGTGYEIVPGYHSIK